MINTGYDDNWWHIEITVPRPHIVQDMAAWMATSKSCVSLVDPQDYPECVVSVTWITRETLCDIVHYGLLVCEHCCHQCPYLRREISILSFVIVAYHHMHLGSSLSLVPELVWTLWEHRRCRWWFYGQEPDMNERERDISEWAIHRKCSPRTKYRREIHMASVKRSRSCENAGHFIIVLKVESSSSSR